MKFKAFLKHSMVIGGDHVHTTNLIDVVTSTKERALEKLKDIIKDDYNDDMFPDKQVDSAELYCIAEIVSVDVDAIYDEVVQEQHEDMERQVEEEERAELARLQEKYPDPQ